jgi:hypothetical protein
MKNIIHKSLVFALLFLVILGCSMFEQKPQTIASNDGSCQLTVPGNWSKQTDLNKEATLQVANPREEVYAIIIRENKSEFPAGTTIDTVTRLAGDNLRKTLTNPEVSSVSSMTVGGFPAKQFDAGGTVSGLKAKYLYAVVESPTSYYQIMTWTLADRYDKNKAKLQDVINSFKEISTK